MDNTLNKVQRFFLDCCYTNQQTTELPQIKSTQSFHRLSLKEFKRDQPISLKIGINNLKFSQTYRSGITGYQTHRRRQSQKLPSKLQIESPIIAKKGKDLKMSVKKNKSSIKQLKLEVHDIHLY